MRVRLLIMLLAALLASCGGSSGGSQNSSPGPINSPTPTPTPIPTPTIPAATVTVTYLHAFQTSSVADGGQPNGPLLQASDGNFYGTTRAGGTNKCRTFENFCGTVFRITPSGDEAVLYSFGANPSDGQSPNGPLLQASNGLLYGTTSNGGLYGRGTVYQIGLDGVYKLLYSFGASPSDGSTPAAGLVEGRDGYLYGTTASGGANHCDQIPQSGSNCGTVFRISTQGAETLLYSFGAAPSDGIEPTGSLIQANDGNFYGTTLMGGTNTCGTANSCGTVFRMTPSGSVTIMHSFGATADDGIAPQGTLIQANDGQIYGTTPSGGTGSCGWSYRCGTVFRMSLTGSIATLHSFAVPGTLNGYGPSQFLIQANDGFLYGTTGSGGAQGGDLAGTAFRLGLDGTYTILHSFGPLNTDPSNPVGGLIQARDGAFYGITAYNGHFGSIGAMGGSGAVYRLAIR